MNNDNQDFRDLDYEKLNALLADPEFANWYYNNFSKDSDNIGINEFVNILNDYSNTHNTFE
ncbi:MAG: hypothetical protein IJH34_12735 [Romboutsia sp.]|nr:hypothetical protein [Romboutsia sp.]